MQALRGGRGLSLPRQKLAPRAEAKVVVAEATFLSSTCRCSRLSTQCCREAVGGYRSADWARASLDGELAMTLFWFSDVVLLEVILPETTDCSPRLSAGLARVRTPQGHRNAQACACGTPHGAGTRIPACVTLSAMASMDVLQMPGGSFWLSVGRSWGEHWRRRWLRRPRSWPFE